MAFQGEEERDLEGRGKKPGAGEPVPCIPVFLGSLKEKVNEA